MSTTADGAAVPGCRPLDATPVTIDAGSLDSTDVPSLRSLKRRLDAGGYVPATLEVEADFGVDCSLSTQAEAERLREYLAVADFLGTGTVRLSVGTVANERKVRPAIAALRERAEREGLDLVVDADDL